jgi:hypothetical protein
MVIHYFNVYGAGRTVRPLKADPPLIVDADAEQSLAVAFEGFQPVARYVQIPHRNGGIKLVKLQFRPPLDSGKGFDPLAPGKFPRALISVANYHIIYYSIFYGLRKA